jgi:hypothetical protein
VGTAARSDHGRSFPNKGAASPAAVSACRPAAAGAGWLAAPAAQETAHGTPAGHGGRDPWLGRGSHGLCEPRRHGRAALADLCLLTLPPAGRARRRDARAGMILLSERIRVSSAPLTPMAVPTGTTGTMLRKNNA